MYTLYSTCLIIRARIEPSPFNYNFFFEFCNKYNFYNFCSLAVLDLTMMDTGTELLYLNTLYLMLFRSDMSTMETLTLSL